MKKIEAKADGTHLEIEDVDLVAGTKTVTRTAEHPDGADVQADVVVDADVLERQRTGDREQKQLDRMVGKIDEIKTSLDALKAMTPLTNTDYPAGPEREMAKQVKEMRKVSIDLAVAVLALVRVTRGLAAEDDE